MPASQVVNTLTDYARGVFPGLVAAQDPLIMRMAPIVRVAGATGKYKSFNDQNAFQKVGTDRAIGGPAVRLEFNATDADYNCTPHALEIAVDDHEREQAGGADAMMEEAKVKTVLSTAAVSHVNDVVTVAKAGVASTATKTYSTPSSGTPILDIDGYIETIANTIGMFPTDIIFGLAAWKFVRNHDSVIARFPGATQVGVNTAQFAGLLLNPGIRIGITTAIRDAVKAGGTKATANILGSEVWIFYTSENPTQYDASFMKTFSTGSGSIESVRRYREDRNRSDILATDWSRDIRVTSTASVIRFIVN